MRYLISALLLFFTLSLVLAQAPLLTPEPVFSGEAPHLCGQVNTPEQIAFLKSNNPNLNFSARSSMDTIRVPVLFHRIADENGNGAVTEADCANALVALNALYETGRIVFEECESPRLIADSVFFDYEYDEEFALRQAHEVSGVINVFIPNRATSSSGGQVCGYAYLPPTRRDITIVAAGCFTNGTTFPHEVGHFLGLYHTHGTSNCGELTDELVDGSNCDTRGDDVCDTPADPNLLGIDCDRYVVDRSCNYTGTETDANGQAFAPDTRNIMSYSRKACREGFSAGQLDRIRFYLGTSRSYLTCPTSICESSIPTPSITGQNMTSISITFDDNGQDRTEIEYTLNGAQPQGFSTPNTSISIEGLSPCENVSIRTRNICPDGKFGDWSASISGATNGCGLRYCPQPNSSNEVVIDELGLNGIALPDLQTEDFYGIHNLDQTIVLDPSTPLFTIDAKIVGNGLPAYFQVWIDVDDNGVLEANENVLQELVLSTSYSFTVPVAPTVIRGIPIRARFTVSQEEYVDPCDIELGETEDVNIIFEETSQVVLWSEETLQLDAPAQMIEAAISADVNWSLSGLPSWIASPNGSSGSSSETEIELNMLRNEGCDSRSATLILTGVNGSRDEIIITQNPAAVGISIDSPDTLFVEPISGVLEMSSNSAHLYQAESSENWLFLSQTGLIDENTLRSGYSTNRTNSDRSTALNYEGCGALETIIVIQEVGRTSWESTIDVQINAIGDTVRLPVLSNNTWEALSEKPWLDPVTTRGIRNGDAAFVYTGNASSGEVTEVEVEGDLGIVDGPTTVRVIAPLLSSTQQPRLSAKLILPNPISDRLVATTASAKTYFWSVHSSLGQQLYASFGESLELDTASWPAGTYFVKLQDESGSILVERVVKF